MEIYNNLKLTSHSHQLRFNQELRRREGECEREAGEGKKEKKPITASQPHHTHFYRHTHTQPKRKKLCPTKLSIYIKFKLIQLFFIC